MAEELREDAEVKQNCEKLLALLRQKELSNEDKDELKTMLEEKPELILQKDFVAGLNVFDLNTAYKNGADINDLVFKSAQAQQDLRQILDNLKEVKLKTKNGQEKPAAALFLDEALLENGELVGTQLVKNIHFLGTAKKDKAHQFYADEGKNEAARNALSAHLNQMGGFYKELYEKPDGYCANGARRNASGQKVGELMALYNAGHEGRFGKAPETIETLKDSPLMSMATPENVENTRDERIVGMFDGKTLEISENQELTDEQLKEGAYRGTLTAAQHELYNKKKKEGAVEKFDGDKSKLPDKTEKGEKFKEQDIVQYMYEEWFLALMSWGFDKAEGLATAALYSGWASYKEFSTAAAADTAKVKDLALKAAREKLDVFRQGAAALAQKLGKSADAELQKYGALYADLKAGHNNPAQRQQLENRCGKDFMRRLDESEDKKGFLRLSQKEINLSLSALAQTGNIALLLTEAEMVDEMMQNKDAWKRDGEYKSDSDLQRELQDRALKRQKEINSSLAAVIDDARVTSEAYFVMGDAKQKEQFITREIYASFNRLALSFSADAAQSEKWAQKKKLFEADYNKYKNNPAAQAELVCQTYAALEANLHLQDMISRARNIQTKQEEKIKANRFDVIGKKPNKDVRSMIAGADTSVKNITKNAVSENVEAQKGLLDAALEVNAPLVMQKAADIVDLQLGNIEGKKAKVAERKTFLKQIKEKITKRTAQNSSEYSPLYASVFGKNNNQGR
ncbi:MAG: hypothetical protein J5895_03700 [Alphaproteobacteria bacterium]|nr:hypothetical protein [Alphaproteobacteria bacterium]